jgi:hypothetical protein
MVSTPQGANDEDRDYRLALELQRRLDAGEPIDDLFPQSPTPPTKPIVYSGYVKSLPPKKEETLLKTALDDLFGAPVVTQSSPSKPPAAPQALDPFEVPPPSEKTAAVKPSLDGLDFFCSPGHAASSGGVAATRSSAPVSDPFNDFLSSRTGGHSDGEPQAANTVDTKFHQQMDLFSGSQVGGQPFGRSLNDILSRTQRQL